VASGVYPQEAHLHPVPITFQVDESTPRISDWRVQNIEYCNQVGSSSIAVLQLHMKGKRSAAVTLPGRFTQLASAPQWH
jgi:hypothetical protein